MVMYVSYRLGSWGDGLITTQLIRDAERYITINKEWQATFYVPAVEGIETSDHETLMYHILAKIKVDCKHIQVVNRTWWHLHRNIIYRYIK